MNNTLPNLPDGFEYHLDLKSYVTPRLLKGEPIHNWYYFPHSFSPQLVDKILLQYEISQGSMLLDPFMGAGTTILRAKQLGLSAIGGDLSPLSVLVTKTKLKDYDVRILVEVMNDLLFSTRKVSHSDRYNSYRLKKAFTQNESAKLSELQLKIQGIEENFRSFFILALLITQQELSRAVPDGGWFRWIEKPDASEMIYGLFQRHVLKMITDLDDTIFKKEGVWKALLLDARSADSLIEQFDAIITSPPYPNRHDYSRIFHIDLLSIGLSEEKISDLRYKSIRSHVEAKSIFPTPMGYRQPDLLHNCIRSLQKNVDRRIVPMLEGYFEDMFIALKAANNVLKVGAPCVLVIGNVRHAGVMIPVDELLIDIGEQVGYTFSKAIVARLRGNSAQQMSKYGRQPARETIVVLHK